MGMVRLEEKWFGDDLNPFSAIRILGNSSQDFVACFSPSKSLCVVKLVAGKNLLGII